MKIAGLGFSLLLSITVHAFEATCIKNSILRGSSCNSLLVHFDFTGCGDTAPKARNVRTQCVNQKAVAFVKTSDAIYFATYAAPLKENEEWRFLTLRSEPRSSQGTGLVNIPPPPASKSSGVSTENLATPATAEAPKDEEDQAPPKEKSAAEKNKVTSENLDHCGKAGGCCDKGGGCEMESGCDHHAGGCEMEESCDMDHHQGHHEKSSGIQHSGFVDIYYMYSGNNPTLLSLPSGTSNNLNSQPASNVQYRAYDAYAGNLSLALAELTLKKDYGNAGGQIDLGFGNSTSLMSPNDIAGQNLLQAKIYFKGERWKFTIGKMFTNVTLEEPYSKENFNYSRSLLFTYAEPLWHNGAAFEYQLVPGKLSTSLYIYNSWSGEYQTNQPYAGARIAWTPNEKLSFNYNGIVETSANNANGGNRQVHELNATWKPNKDQAFAAEYIWGYQQSAFLGMDAQWSGFEIMAKRQWGKFGLAPRFEYLFDPQGFAVSGLLGASTTFPYVTQNLMSGTLTVSYEVQEGAQVLLEVRQDSSDVNSFNNGVGAALTNQQTTGTLAFLYEF